MKPVKAWALTNGYDDELETDLHGDPILYNTRLLAWTVRYNRGRKDVRIVRVEIREIRPAPKRRKR